MTRDEMLAALAAQGMTMGPAGVPVPFDSPAHLMFNANVPDVNTGGPFQPGPPPGPQINFGPDQVVKFGGPPVKLNEPAFVPHDPLTPDQNKAKAAADYADAADPMTPAQKAMAAKAQADFAAASTNGIPKPSADGGPMGPPVADDASDAGGPPVGRQGAPIPTGPAYATIAGHNVSQVSPGARSEFDAAGQVGMKALDAQRDAEMAGIQAHREQQAAIADAMEAERQKAAQREAQRTTVLRANEDEQMKLSDQIARTQINPDHLWASKSDGEKVLGFLAMVAGGFLAGKNGGPNMALEELNRQIDRDVDAQKANLANQRGKLTDLKGVYAQKIARFGDERTAEAAAKSDMLAAVVAHGDAMATDASSAGVTARWEAGRSELLDKKAKLDGFILDKWQGPQVVQTGGGGAGSGSADKNIDKLFTYRGKTYQAPSPDAAGKMQARIAAAGTLTKAGNEIDSIRSDPSWIVSPEKTARLHALGLQMRGAYITANDLSPKLIENDSFVQDLGNPTAFFSHSGALAKQVAATTQANVSQAFDEMRPEQVERGHAMDTQGQVKPIASYTGDTGKKAELPSDFK